MDGNQFWDKVAEATYPTNTMVTGEITIQQTERNKLRREALDALRNDLAKWYDGHAEIVTTKQGLVIVVEGQDDYTISFELKLTIKGLNYDPFLAANEFEDEENARCAKAKARAEAQVALEAKRAARRAASSVK